MTFIGIKSAAPLRSVRITRSTVSFTAARWAAKRYVFNVRQLIYDPGSERSPHLRFTGNTRKAGGYYLGIFSRKRDGRVSSPIRWERISAVRGADFIIGKRREGKDLVIQYLTGKMNIRLDNLSAEAQSDFETLRKHIHHVTITPEGRLEVHYRHMGSDTGSDMGTRTYDIPVKIPRLGTIFQDKDNPQNEYHVRLCTERLSGTGLEVLSRDGGGVIQDYRRGFYLQVCTYAESRIRGAASKVGEDEDFTVIHRRAEIEVEHLDDYNGRSRGETEFIPYNQKIQHFPHLVNTDPETLPAYQSGFVDHSLDNVVAPQHLVAEYPDLAQVWCKNDQMGFFGERLRGFMGHPYGAIEGLDTPLWMPEGAHSLQYGKSLEGAAICTGNGAVLRAPWHLLFEFEELGSDDPYVSSLVHFRTITEDAQGADEKNLVMGLTTRMRRDPVTVGSSVPTVHAAEEQRWRWASEIGFYLSWGVKYLKDEIVRNRVYGALSHIPLAGRPFEKRKIPSLYTPAQIHEWFNVGTWYIDSLCKYAFAVLPATYIVLGMTPLPATVMFAGLWAAKTLIGWPAFSYQSSKMAIPWKNTFFPIPKDIFTWYLMCPYIARGVLHQEDKATGPFRPTETIGGLRLPHYVKRHLFYIFTAVPLGTAAIGAAKLAIFGFKFGILMNTFWPFFMGAGALYALHLHMKQHKVFRERDGKTLAQTDTWKTFLIQGSGWDPFVTDAAKWLKGKL